MINKLLSKYKEPISYLFFGGLTTLVNWIVYTISLEFFSVKVEIANVIAWIVAVIFAYITNKLFVFQSKGLNFKSTLKEIGLFFASRITSGLVEIFGFPFLYYLGLNQSFLGIDGFVAKILISIIVIILNYIFSKLIVFRKNKGTN